MKYESTHNLQLPKIGFGTWTIGGRSTPERSQDARSLAALRSALELGYTHFDTAETYAHGHAEELLGQAVRACGLRREALMITSKVAPEHLAPADVLQACENSLRNLGLEYIDLYLIHWPGVGMHLDQTFRALNKLVTDGKVRHLGVSNFDLKLLKQAQSLCETPIVCDQVPYSLSDRTYVRNGVLAYCQANNILLTAYSPIKQGSAGLNPAVQSIARAHQATPHQVALAWLAQQARVITIPMSFDPGHQAQNLAAAGIDLSAAEMEQLSV